MKNLLLAFLFVSCLGANTSRAYAQGCSPPEIVPDSKIYNIFSPEQEMVFGELTYQRMSGDLRFVKDPQLAAYLNNLGQNLAKHLPPTGLKFQFFIVDLPAANAFNIPGGYVFVSRKLIGLTNNEDELAGVIAHELGHAAVRHSASDMSALLKKILNVTQLGDRKDVVEKYNLLLERRRTKSVSQRADHESDQQLQADRVGLFAMVAAGYDPNAFASFFGRLTETKEKSGNWFSDIFDKPKPEEKRLLEMIKVTDRLPAECREARQASASEAFLNWQAKVVSFRDLNKKEDLAGLVWKKELAPKLRSDISHFSFSPDGKFFLAQDDFAITVIKRDPLEIMFQIPATDSRKAAFTPDGQFVVFISESLRYEKWSVSDKKPVEIRELVVRRDCWEHEISPDGQYLACVDYGLGLNVLETKSGKKIWEKKNFVQLNVFELLNWILGEASGLNEEFSKHFFSIEFSPDSSVLAVSRSNNFRMTLTIDYLAAVKTEDTLVALDLTTRKPMSVGGDLKRLTRRPFLFLDSTRILAMAPEKLEDGGIFSFPEGRRVTKFPISARELLRTANKNLVIVKPLANAKLGVFDLTKNAIVNAMDKNDAALWENMIVYESVSGSVRVAELNYDQELKRFQSKNLGTIEVPVGSIGRLEAADISDNLQWLAASSKTRGAIWSLGTGERKMHLRGFRGAMVADSGDWIGDFPRHESVNHSLVILKPRTNEAISLREVPERGAKQYRRYLLSRQSLRTLDKNAKEKSDQDKGSDIDTQSSEPLTRDVRFELYDLINNRTVWTADFVKEAPRFFFDEFSGRLILYWTLANDRAKARLKENPALAARAKEMGNKDDDYLVEVVDAYAGKSVGTLLLETGKGSFHVDYGFSEGDWLVLHDSNNRVLAYSITDGNLRYRFFGSNAVVNPAKNQIVVENYPGELTFYDLSSGDSQTRLTFPESAAFLRFSLDGKKLFVLSGQQIAYVFDVEQLPTKSAAVVQ